MDNCILIPYVSVGPIVFGMSQEQVREVMGTPSDEFRATMAADSDRYDVYRIHGGDIRIGYPAVQNICVSVEVVNPLGLIVSGENIMGRNLEEILDWVKKIDREVVVDSAGFVSHLMGFGVYAEHQEEDEKVKKIVSAIGFCKDYWKKIDS